MNLLVVATGGTIGSAATNAVISPDGAQTLRLLELYKEHYPKDENHFETYSLCSVLSENANDAFYETLLSHFKQNDFSAFDGVILLHGTDTLSFTAPLLAMALREFPKAFCLVSSNHVLEETNANGLDNFRAAVRYIESGNRGFVVPYKNSDGRTYYHLATHLLEADPFLDDFHSAYDLPLGEYKEDAVVFNEDNKLPTPEALKVPREALFFETPKFEKNILFLRSAPNLDFFAIELDKKQTAAVLLTAYHSGTAAEAPLKAFAKRAKEKGIEVYLAPVKRAETQYASTDALLKENVHPLYGMTPEAALAKLKLAYHHPTKTPEEVLSMNLYFEEIF